MNRRPPLALLVRPLGISKLFGLGLGYGLLMLLDGYLLLLTSRRVGTYLLIAATATTSLVGALGTFRAYTRELQTLYSKVRRGAYPKSEYVRMLSLLVAAGLLIVPGLATDAVGVVIAIRPFGWLVGVLLERTLRRELELLYEHLRLET